MARKIPTLPREAKRERDRAPWPAEAWAYYREAALELAVYRPERPARNVSSRFRSEVRGLAKRAILECFRGRMAVDPSGAAWVRSDALSGSRLNPDVGAALEILGAVPAPRTSVRRTSAVTLQQDLELLAQHVRGRSFDSLAGALERKPRTWLRVERATMLVAWLMETVSPMAHVTKEKSVDERRLRQIYRESVHGYLRPKLKNERWFSELVIAALKGLERFKNLQQVLPLSSV